MRKLLSFAILFCSLFSIQAQTSIYLEDFEGANPTVTSYTANGGTERWATTTSYSFSGVKSDSGKVVLSDTLFLETNTINASTATFLTLEFKQICKIDFFDKGMIQVSNDNGTSWTTLTSADYNGSGFLNANAFSAISYTVWDAANGSSMPANSWWKSESFDLSSHASNSSQVKIRFALIDANNNGASNNYGWLIDDIELLGASCELVPPTITLTGTILQGTVYSTGPYTIEANIQDPSGIASAVLNYTKNGVAASPITMNIVSANTYRGIIPNALVNDTICYSIQAVDATTCANTAIYPSTNCVQFIVKSNPPPSCVGLPIFNYPYTETFGSFTSGNGQANAGTLSNNWINDTGDSHDWWVYNQATRSANTGPSADHSNPPNNFLYVEASGFANETAILNTPCYDFTNLLAPKFSFYYHMYGATMGELHVDIFHGGVWIMDIMPAVIGNQGDQWNFQEISLAAYAGSIVKLRFRAKVGSSFTSDIAIDDIEIVEPVSTDISLSSIVSPSSGIGNCNGTANEYLTVELTNSGSLQQSNVPVFYQLNSGTVVTDTAKFNIPPGASANFTFQNPINMSAPGSYTFSFWTALPNDAILTNDSILNFIVTTSFIETSFPDTTNFDNFTAGTPGVFLESWGNDQADAHDWYVNSGTTPSNQTGPTTDHTTEFGTGTGNYIYIEATNFSNLEANLFSKCYDISQLNKPELTFYTHMRGIDMGTLHLDIYINGFLIQDIMTPISGDQGNNWNVNVVDLSQFKGIVKIVFRGIVGGNYRSDIAIDDVSIRDAQPIGIDVNHTKEHTFSLFPNPSDGRFTINSDKQIQQIAVYDLSGRLVWNLNQNFKTKLLNLNELTQGIYFLKYRIDDSWTTKKIVIK
ncbi:MAG: T9SS type A sorting domain-containing protein [Flavobacteriales bacterium]|nr:T9SS type A sorting domain-containing protein [Flavobacteriales bacterium]